MGDTGWDRGGQVTCFLGHDTIFSKFHSSRNFSEILTPASSSVASGMFVENKNPRPHIKYQHRASFYWLRRAHAHVFRTFSKFNLWQLDQPGKGYLHLRMVQIRACLLFLKSWLTNISARRPCYPELGPPALSVCLEPSWC